VAAHVFEHIRDVARQRGPACGMDGAGLGIENLVGGRASIALSTVAASTCSASPGAAGRQTTVQRRKALHSADAAARAARHAAAPVLESGKAARGDVELHSMPSMPSGRPAAADTGRASMP
jgi:hypothetical protein